MESTSQLRCVLVCQFTVSFPTSKLCYKCLSYNDIFFMTLGLRSFEVCCITYGNKVWNNVRLLRFVFIHDRFCSWFFISSQLPYLFVWCSYDFDDARIALYFGTFELCMEMTWKLRFAFFRHFLVPYNYVIYFFNLVTFFDDVRKRFYFGTFELHMEITLQLRFVFVCHCNVFFNYVKITLFVCSM